MFARAQYHQQGTPLVRAHDLKLGMNIKSSLSDFIALLWLKMTYLILEVVNTLDSSAILLLEW